MSLDIERPSWETFREGIVQDRTERLGEVAYTPINDKHPDNTDPATLVAGRATPMDAMHIATPTTLVKVTASRGTYGNAASVPSAFAMALLLRDGVGEKGRRA